MKDVLSYLPTGIFVEHRIMFHNQEAMVVLLRMVMSWKTKDAAVQYDGFKRIEPGMDIGWI